MRVASSTRDLSPSSTRPGNALSERNFLLAWLASIVSNTGSWLQQIAVPVVIYEITHRTLWLGVAGFAGLISGAVTTLVGGPLADRYDRRRILIATNLVQGGCAFALWGLWVSGHAHLAPMLAALVVAGLASGVAVTTWQSIQPLLVPRELIASAVRMNSTQYAISRALGPAIGTLVLRQWGAATCFFSNAVSFLFVVGAMVVVQARPQPVLQAGPGLRAELREGRRYLMSDASLRFPPVGILLVSGLAVTWTSLAAAIAAEHFGRPATDSGMLVTAYGVGSVLTGVLAGRATRVFRRSRLAVAAMAIAAMGLTLVAVTRSFALGMVGMFLLGIGHLTTSVVLNTAIQLHAHERLRGRVMGIYLQCSFVGNATGALLNAKVADAISVRIGLLLDAALLSIPLLIGLRGGLAALDGDHVVPPPPELVASATAPPIRA